MLAILVGTTPIVVQADDAPLEVKGLTFKHGIAFFGELKYPADFTHFDYLNPDAPKGGEIAIEAPYPKDLRILLSKMEKFRRAHPSRAD